MELSESTQIKLIEDVATTKQAVLDIKKAMEENNKEVANLLKSHNFRIKDLEAYKNEMVGRISLIAVVCGIIGWFITTGIGYFLHK